VRLLVLHLVVLRALLRVLAQVLRLVVLQVLLVVLQVLLLVRWGLVRGRELVFPLVLLQVR